MHPGLEVIKLFSCSTQQSKKFQLLIKTKIPTNEEVSCFKPLRGWFIMLLNVKMPTIVGILTFMSKIYFVLSWVEHEKKLYNLGVWFTRRDNSPLYNGSSKYVFGSEIRKLIFNYTTYSRSLITIIYTHTHTHTRNTSYSGLMKVMMIDDWYEWNWWHFWFTV